MPLARTTSRSQYSGEPRVIAAAANSPYTTFSPRLTMATCTIGYTAVSITSPNTILTPANKALYIVIRAVNLSAGGGGVQDFTGDFPTWWTDDTAIATANKNSIHGVAAGTTNHHAESDPMYWGIRKAFNSCPISRPQTTASTHVGPYQVEPIATASQFPAACPNGQAGWNRNVTNQLQYLGGSAYAVSGVKVADVITIGSRHDLGSGTSTGSATTTGDGSFTDNYSVCSPACTSPNSGETDALQNWTAGTSPLPHANALVYKCGSITIDGN